MKKSRTFTNLTCNSRKLETVASTSAVDTFSPLHLQDLDLSDDLDLFQVMGKNQKCTRIECPKAEKWPMSHSQHFFSKFKLP